MELQETAQSAFVLRSGNQDNVIVSAGKSLKIKTSPQGEEILNAECPQGKTWIARLIVEITETDA